MVLGLREATLKPESHLCHGDGVGRDDEVVGPGGGQGLLGEAEDLQEVQCRIRFRGFVLGLRGRFRSRRPGPAGLDNFQPLFEKFGPLAELIVVEQLTYEFFAGIRFAPGSRRIRGEQGSGLDVDQQCREVDEVGAEIDVEFLGAV